MVRKIGAPGSAGAGHGRAGPGRRRRCRLFRNEDDRSRPVGIGDDGLRRGARRASWPSCGAGPRSFGGGDTIAAGRRRRDHGRRRAGHRVDHAARRWRRSAAEQPARVIVAVPGRLPTGRRRRSRAGRRRGGLPVGPGPVRGRGRARTPTSTSSPTRDVRRGLLARPERSADVDLVAVGQPDQVGVAQREHRVRDAAGGPELRRSRPASGRPGCGSAADARPGRRRRSAGRCGCGRSRPRPGAAEGRSRADPVQVDPVPTAGHDQHRLAVGRGEDQRVGDRADLAAELVGGGRGRRGGLGRGSGPGPGRPAAVEDGVDGLAARMQCSIVPPSSGLLGQRKTRPHGAAGSSETGRC